MFFVIGGVPRSGKSTLAIELGQRLNVPSLPVDAFIEAIQAIDPDGLISYSEIVPEDQVLAFFGYQ